MLERSSIVKRIWQNRPLTRFQSHGSIVGMGDSDFPPQVADVGGEAPAKVNGSSTAEVPVPKYVASISKRPLSQTFAQAVLGLEKTLGMPLWLLVQDGRNDQELDNDVEEAFFSARYDLPQNSPVALLIESPGGQADCAYRIAKLLQRRCGGFVAVIVNWAKSAATLLTLGASQIIIGEHAQLGPLDAQLFDPDREEFNSALNETQAFERLHATALEALDQTVLMLKMRTGKRIDAILPHSLKFIADTMRPLLEKVDVVQYTNRLRTLKVAEEYATRLLLPTVPPKVAQRIARHLVEKYPEHGFVIDFDEARRIGLPNVSEPTQEQTVYMDQILLEITSISSAFGRVIVS